VTARQPANTSPATTKSAPRTRQANPLAMSPSVLTTSGYETRAERSGCKQGMNAAYSRGDHTGVQQTKSPRFTFPMTRRSSRPLLCAWACVLVALAHPSAQRADARAQFERGLSALHQFEYEDANEAFREAQRIDPAFAMAYWGE